MLPSTVVNLQRYKCHKEVYAAKILYIDPVHDKQDDRQDSSVELYNLMLDSKSNGSYLVVIRGDWYRKHKPEVGGYYVLYEDGYESYSPAKAFEEGYTKL